MYRVFICVFCIVLLAFTTGCNRQTKLNLEVLSLPDVNPDHTGRPSPVVLKIFELRASSNFEHTDFLELYDTPMEALGQDFVAAEKITLVPGEVKKAQYSLRADSRYIGFVAAFRRIGNAQWRIYKPVKVGGANPVRMEVGGTALTLVPDGKLWTPEKILEKWTPDYVRAGEIMQQSNP